MFSPTYLLRYLLGILMLSTLSACRIIHSTANDPQPGQASFPEDEAVHPNNSLEWWYYTGNLERVDNGELFGVELVFFHYNIKGKRQYLMTHVALTDPATGKHHYSYRINKLGEPLSTGLPLDLTAKKKGRIWRVAGQEGRYQLRAFMEKHDGVGFSVKTRPGKGEVMHSGTGYEVYGDMATAGYVSYPRLEAEGVVFVEGDSVAVKGDMWYDRQWNCGSIPPDDFSWDWFSVQLDSPRAELMVYQLRDKRNGRYVNGGGFLAENGNYQHLSNGDIGITPRDFWYSKDTKRYYPISWTLELPILDMQMEVDALVEDQEFMMGIKGIKTFQYWEGMCRAQGKWKGKTISGRSFVELTGRPKGEKFAEGEKSLLGEPVSGRP